MIIIRKGKSLPKLWAVFSIFQERSYRMLFGLLKLLRILGPEFRKANSFSVEMKKVFLAFIKGYKRTVP
jgi:hypothetical protein